MQPLRGSLALPWDPCWAVLTAVGRGWEAWLAASLFQVLLMHTPARVYLKSMVAVAERETLCPEDPRTPGLRGPPVRTGGQGLLTAEPLTKAGAATWPATASNPMGGAGKNGGEYRSVCEGVYASLGRRNLKLIWVQKYLEVHAVFS